MLRLVFGLLIAFTTAVALGDEGPAKPPGTQGAGPVRRHLGLRCGDEASHLDAQGGARQER